jgi:hypothetical protein
MEIQNEIALNRIISDFQLACSIHDTVHKTILDLPHVLTKFPPENRALRKALATQFLEMLSSERDEILESAISAYKFYKQSRINQSVPTNPEPSQNQAKV